ncbi:peptidase inhibitor family I36 protein [Catellatospora methionotrophica]|uniref:peptidase inhibitor family I36 protein n=1 Tax=Catellatospora methionotrophica TaxID=121620 RepID=UPI00340B9ED5
MRSPKQIIASIGLVGLMTTLAVGGLTGTASADACPSGATCAYTTTNWGGAPGPVYGNNTDLRSFAKWTGAESIYNNGTQCNVYVYSSTSYGGTRYPLNKGTGWKTISGSAIWHHAWSNKWFGTGC